MGEISERYGKISSTTEVTSDIINKIVSDKMVGADLSANQIKMLNEALDLTLSKYQIKQDHSREEIIEIQRINAEVLKDFINAKRIEGRSNTTLYNYAKESSKMFLTINKAYDKITTQDLRDYISYRKRMSGLMNSSVANMRQYLMSFFKWLYNEELIQKNPMARIGVIKTEQHVVQVLSDEEQEVIRCACKDERSRALVDLLSGSGMRISELCALNRQDIDWDNEEVVVMGKGSKERVCFLTGRAKVHLKWYLESRTDNNEALFVTAKHPYNRLTKSGAEFLLHDIARSSKIPTIRLYPHKYRSTLATNMINKGAEASQVQGILGHSSVDTTLKCYCKVDKETYKATHKRFTD